MVPISLAYLAHGGKSFIKASSKSFGKERESYGLAHRASPAYSLAQKVGRLSVPTGRLENKFWWLMKCLFLVGTNSGGTRQEFEKHKPG